VASGREGEEWGEEEEEGKETFGVGCGFDLVHELEIGKVVDVDLVLQRNDDLVPSQLHSFSQQHRADHKDG
jgi:hypothetical protein